MIQPRKYLTRSTRDGLGIVPDGTHPVLEDGSPDFEAFTNLGQVLDYVRNDANPDWDDLVASVQKIKLSAQIMAVRSMVSRAQAGDDTATDFWMAVYVLTTSLRREAERVQDPISISQLRMIAATLDADGMPVLVAAGYLFEEPEPEAEAPAAKPLTEAQVFADIIEREFPEEKGL